MMSFLWNSWNTHIACQESSQHMCASRRVKDESRFDLQPLLKDHRHFEWLQRLEHSKKMGAHPLALVKLIHRNRWMAGEVEFFCPFLFVCISSNSRSIFSNWIVSTKTHRNQWPKNSHLSSCSLLLFSLILCEFWSKVSNLSTWALFIICLGNIDQETVNIALQRSSITSQIRHNLQPPSASALVQCMFACRSSRAMCKCPFFCSCGWSEMLLDELCAWQHSMTNTGDVR